MCSTLNPPDAETCKLCGARLQPTGRLGTPAEEPAAGMRLPPTGELPAWLARLRKDVTGRDDITVVPPPDETPLPPEEGGPDWLGDLRKADSEEEGPPVGEVPDWLAAEAPEPAPAQEGSVPDWLARIRAKAQSEAPLASAAEGRPRAPSAPEAAFVPEDLPEPESEATAEPTLGLPEWLLGARPEGGQGQPET